MSLDFNRDDLSAHHEEFQRRLAFAYTVFGPAGSDGKHTSNPPTHVMYGYILTDCL